MRTLVTPRLALEPQVVAHADAMFIVLSDPALYAYENEPPPSIEWLRERFEKLETRRSGDDREQWLNWVVRRAEGEVVGYVQATVSPDGRAAIAYVLASAWWGRGFAQEAVEAMVDELVAHYGVQSLTAVLKATNERSRRLLLRLGFALASPVVAGSGEIEADEVIFQRFASHAGSKMAMPRKEVAMSATPEAVARQWFARVWNEGSERAIHDMLAADAKMHGLPTPDGQPIVGPAAFVPFWRKFRAAFPDIRIEVARSISEGDMVAVHCHVVGSHLGNDLGIQATQRPIDFWGMGMARVHDGKIVEAWNCYDFQTMYTQVGLLPAL